MENGRPFIQHFLFLHCFETLGGFIVKDHNKTKSQLIAELDGLRQQLLIANQKEIQENSGKYFTVMLNALPNPIWLKDQDGVFLACNKRFEEVFGATEAEITGKTDYDFIEDKMADFFRAKDKTALLAGKPTTNEEEMVSATDGHKGLFETLKTPLYDSQDELIGVLGISHDITERKSLLNALRVSEELYRNLIESTSAIAWEVDLATLKFTYISPKILEISGYHSGLWVDFDYWVKRIHPDDRKEAAGFCQAKTSKGVDHSFDYRIVAKDGTIKWIRDLVNVIKEDGKSVKLRGYFLDITESKNVENKLKQYRHIVSSTKDMMAFLDTDFKYLAANQAYLDGFGFSPDKLIGKELNQVFSKDYFENKIRPNAIRCLAGEHINFQSWVEFPVSGKIFMEVNYYPYKDSGNKVLGFVVNARDITKQKMAENEKQVFQNLTQKLGEPIPIHSAGKIISREAQELFDFDAFSFDLIDEANDMLLGIYNEDTDIGMDFPQETLVNSWPLENIKNRGVLFKGETKLINRTEKLKAKSLYSFGYLSRPSQSLMFVPIKHDQKIVGIVSVQSYTPKKYDKAALELFTTFVDHIGGAIVRIQYENALSENEFFLNESQKVASIGSYKCDITNGLWQSSETLNRIVGITDRFDKNIAVWKQFVHPEDQVMISEYFLTNVLGNRKPFNKEFRIIRNNDQKESWVHALGELEFDQDGNPIRMIGTVQDINERKNMELSLVESEERYRGLFEASFEAIFISEKGVCLEQNSTAERMFGYSLEEAKGKIGTEWIVQKDRDMVMNKMISGTEDVYDATALRKDGSTFPAEIQARMMHYKGKSVRVTALRDITLRKQADEELRKLSAATEQSPISTVITNPDGNIEYVNPEFTKVTGYSKEEVIGRNPRLLKSGLQPSEHHKQLWETIITGKTWRGEFHNKKKNGEFYWAEASISAIFDENGKIRHFLAVNEDITKRKQTAENLEQSYQSQQVLNALLKNSLEDKPFQEGLEQAFDIILSAPFMRLSPKGGIFLAKSGKLRLKVQKGLPSELVNKCDSVEFGHCLCGRAAERKEIQFADCVDERHDNTFEGIPEHGHYNIPVLHGSEVIGVIVLYLEHGHVKNNDETDFLKAVANIIAGLIERHRSEEEKIELEKQLRRSQKLETIGTMAGGIAHDFNNILTPIMGYTDMAVMDLPDSGELKQNLNRVLEGAKRAKDLVEQILLFSKQIEKERIPLFLHLIVKEALQLMRSSIPVTIDIVNRIDPNCDKVLADATQMHQVVVNLANNAWHSMEERGGVLTISLKQVKLDNTIVNLYPNLNAAEYVQLTIEDTGHGMDSITQDRIFEPFFTTKAVDKGTGLGLSVVHGIIQNHQGEIIVKSLPDKGTVFEVYLPVFNIESVINEDLPKTVVGGTESILVVDDDSVVGNMLKRMLEKFGYSVYLYHDSPTALKAIEKKPDEYDLIISDFTMPDLTGLDLSKQVQELDSTIPIIIMTGYGEKLLGLKPKEYGVKKVLQKPIVMNDLAIAIREVLDS